MALVLVSLKLSVSTLKVESNYSGVYNWDSRFSLDVWINSFPNVNDSTLKPIMVIFGSVCGEARIPNTEMQL